MTTERRRYTFSTRGEAEDRWRASDRLFRLAEMILEAKLRGELEWFRGRYYEIARFGWDRMDEGGYVVRFLAPDNPPQKPTSRVLTPEQMREERNSMSGWIDSKDREGNELRDLTGKAMSFTG